VLKGNSSAAVFDYGSLGLPTGSEQPAATASTIVVSNNDLHAQMPKNADVAMNLQTCSALTLSCMVVPMLRLTQL
jgi:hypothetical protein